MATRRGARRVVPARRRIAGGRASSRRSTRSTRSERGGAFGLGRAYSRAKKKLVGS